MLDCPCRMQMMLQGRKDERLVEVCEGDERYEQQEINESVMNGDKKIKKQ